MADRLEQIARMNPRAMCKVAALLDNPLYSSLAGAGIGAGAGAIGALVQGGPSDERKERIKSYILAGMVAGGGAGATASLAKGWTMGPTPAKAVPATTASTASTASTGAMAKSDPAAVPGPEHPIITYGLPAISPFRSLLKVPKRLAGNTVRATRNTFMSGNIPDPPDLKWRDVDPRGSSRKGNAAWLLASALAGLYTKGHIAEVMGQQQNPLSGAVTMATDPMTSLMAGIHRVRQEADALKPEQRGMFQRALGSVDAFRQRHTGVTE